MIKWVPHIKDTRVNWAVHLDSKQNNGKLINDKLSLSG